MKERITLKEMFNEPELATFRGKVTAVCATTSKEPKTDETLRKAEKAMDEALAEMGVKDVHSKAEFMLVVSDQPINFSFYRGL